MVFLQWFTTWIPMWLVAPCMVNHEVGDWCSWKRVLSWQRTATVVAGRSCQWTTGVSARSPLCFRGWALDTVFSVWCSAISPPGLLSKKHILKKHRYKIRERPGIKIYLNQKCRVFYQIEIIADPKQYIYFLYDCENRTRSMQIAVSRWAWLIWFWHFFCKSVLPVLARYEKEDQ